MTIETNQFRSPEILNTDFLNSIFESVTTELQQAVIENINLPQNYSDLEDYKQALKKKLLSRVTLSQEQVLEICQHNSQYDYSSSLKYIQAAQNIHKESNPILSSLNKNYIIKKCLSILMLFRQKKIKNNTVDAIPVNLELNDKGLELLCVIINNVIKNSLEAAFIVNEFKGILDMTYRFAKQPKSLNNFRQSYINDTEGDQQTELSETYINLSSQLIIIATDIISDKFRVLNTVLSIKLKS